MGQAGRMTITPTTEEIAERRRQHMDTMKMDSYRNNALWAISKALVVIAVMLGALTLVLAVGVARADAHFYSGCKTKKCMWHVVKPHNEGIKRIAECESGKDWDYNGPSGYDGGVQFSPRTWDSLNGRLGDGYRRYRYAYQAPRLVQKYASVILAARNNWRWQSSGTWPVCGARY